MLFPLLLPNPLWISSNISSVDRPRIRSLNLDLLRSRRSANGIIFRTASIDRTKCDRRLGVQRLEREPKKTCMRVACLETRDGEKAEKFQKSAARNTDRVLQMVQRLTVQYVIETSRGYGDRRTRYNRRSTMTVRARACGCACARRELVRVCVSGDMDNRLI